jgi:DNA primase
VLLFDGDAAGRKATRASRVPCREAGLNARVAVLPAGVDPDDLARKKGPEAVALIVKAARGLLEHLIDEALDGESFGGASLPEQLARVRAVANLLAEEEDPSFRMMGKLYADRVSSKLVITGRSPTDLRQLEGIVNDALHRGDRGASPGGAGPAASREHARSRSQVDDIRLGILGAVIDFPELLEDDEVGASLTVLDGDVALALVAARQRSIPEKGLAADEFLAQIPRSIHSFAAGRLASPAFEAVREAKADLLENAGKLRRLTLKRENAAVVDQLQKGEAMGDVASEEAFLREVQRRSREKHGLS